MTILVEDVITDIQALIASNNPAVAESPATPPENISAFPTTIAYLDDFTADVVVPGLTGFNYSLNIEIHIGLVDLPLDVETIIDYVERIPETLFTAISAYTKTNFRGITEIRYQFGELAWRNQKTIGYLFRLENVFGEKYTAETVPTAPSSLVATAVSTSQIDLTWNDNSDDELAFVVQRSATSGSGFVTIAILAAGTTSYSDTGLSSGATWYYQILANNGAGNSTSNEASATVLSTLILDQFTDTNGVNIQDHTIAPTNIPATSWVVTGASANDRAEIQSNQLACKFGAQFVVVADAGQADVTISVDTIVKSASGSIVVGIVARYVDSDNYWYQKITQNSIVALIERTAGVEVVRSSNAYSFVVDQTYSLQCVLSGTSISMTIDGGSTVNTTSSVHQSADNHGLYVKPEGGGTVSIIYDDFQVV